MQNPAFTKRFNKNTGSSFSIPCGLPVLIAAIIFLSLAAGVGPARCEELKSWTFMVFMNADNDLDSFGPADIRELETIGSSADVNIVVQLDRQNLPARRYRIVKKDESNKPDDWGVISELKAELGEIDMGDYKELVNFVKWSRDNYPAKKYALTIWNHGAGWKKPSGLDSLVSRGISYDYQSKNNITTKQMGIAAASINSILGHRLDVLIMDACLMQMLEIIYEIRENVSYVAASEDIEPENGIPYDGICGALVKSPAIAPRDFSKLVAEAAFNKYNQNAKIFTYSAIDCSKVNDLASIVSALSARLVEIAGENAEALQNARISVQKFTFTDYADLGHFVKIVSESVNDEAIRKLSSDFFIAYQKAVICNKNHGDAVKNATGMSIYLPKYGIKSHYSELKFAELYWEKMLRAVYGLTNY